MDFLLRRVRSDLILLTLGITTSSSCTPLLQPDSYKKKKEYLFGKTLGKGTFGEVKEATWIAKDGMHVAIKVILKKSIKGQHQLIYDEIDVLQGLDHPNIGKLTLCSAQRATIG